MVNAVTRLLKSIYYLEPSWGLEGAKSLKEFSSNLNLGVDFQGQEPLEDWQVSHFSQILYY